MSCAGVSRKFIVTYNRRDETAKVKIDVQSMQSMHAGLKELASVNSSPSFSIEVFHPDTETFCPLTDDLLPLVRMDKRFSRICIIESDLNSSAGDAEVLQIAGRLFDTAEGLEVGGPRGSQTLRISELAGAHLGTGLVIWDGAVLLAKYLEKNRILLQNRSVLELGAGTGISGIAASVLGARHVGITDLQYSLANVEQNIDANLPSYRAQNNSSWRNSDHQEWHRNVYRSIDQGSTVCVSELDWGDPKTYHLPFLREEELPQSANDGGVCVSSGTSKWDLVIAADVVWLDHLVPLLVQALNAVCDESTLFVLAHQVRYTDMLVCCLEGLDITLWHFTSS
jgi:predicted nicotinamide N-methyase